LSAELQFQLLTRADGSTVPGDEVQEVAPGRVEGLAADIAVSGRALHRGPIQVTALSDQGLQGELLEARSRNVFLTELVRGAITTLH
jgi:hypothetical protein